MSEEIKRKRTIWNKILHVPIQGGRELIWTAIGAYAIPSMEILGMPADVGSTVFSASSFVTIFFVLIVGVLSDGCICSIGKRKPFIIICVIFVIFAAIMQFLSLKIEDQLLVQFYFMLLFSSTIYSCEQAQVMQMVAFICGFAGIVGYVLCAILPISSNGVLQLDIFFISVAVFLVGAVLNLFSVKEEPKKEETQTSVFSVFQNIPAKLLKMCLLFLLIFSACFPFYIFFTTCFAESMFDAHRPTIAANENLTEEEIEKIFTDRLTDGSQKASLIFIAFPAGVMIISLVMEKGKIFRRFGIKNTIFSMLIFMIGTLTFNIFFKTTIGFFLIALGIAFSMVIQISVPYMLLNIYREDPKYPKSRGLSSDNSIISCTFSIAQAVGSLLLSLLIKKTETTTVIIPWCLVSAILATVLALTSIDFGKQSQQEEEKNSRKAIDNRTVKLNTNKK
ncbi:unnamed protein product [Oikopleura dioica]|uniref:Major facilitator superfamily (MFS) profile domain-containing protein n=1 Tax=Oikopleura dioica TaxID=34765 RepID=E4XHZ5_OIKDI|nr:unnamed protein product [Oikopleura dioica]